MPTLLLFPFFYKFSPYKPLAFCDRAQHLGDSTLHTSQTAHVEVGLLQLHQVPNLLSIFADFRLDVHFLSCRILLLTGNGIVVAVLIWEVFLVLDILIVPM